MQGFNLNTYTVNVIYFCKGFRNFKEELSNICKQLGAHVNDNLMLRKRDNKMANTHLICHSANGPKYEAAKGKQVVGIGWLIESCVFGVKADERRYKFENQESGNEDHGLIEALDRLRRINEQKWINFYKLKI